MRTADLGLGPPMPRSSVIVGLCRQSPLAIVLMILGGCQSATVFQSNFTSTAVGQPPASAQATGTASVFGAPGSVVVVGSAGSAGGPLAPGQSRQQFSAHKRHVGHVGGAAGRPVQLPLRDVHAYGQRPCDAFFRAGPSAAARRDGGLPASRLHAEQQGPHQRTITPRNLAPSRAISRLTWRSL